MTAESRKGLRRATLVYWVLLLYIIAALVWWFLSLQQQNREIHQTLREELNIRYNDTSAPVYRKELARINRLEKRANTKYLSEGITFLGLIIVGAAYIYRLVKKQFVMQQQQQNFVMAVTHELKTPISVSRLNLETLQKHQLDDEMKSKLLQRALQETMRLDTLINNILISSQLDGNSYKMTMDELNFSDLVQDVITQFNSRYPERKLLKTVEPDVELNGDPLLLKLLVSNLLENANKYSPKDKPISIQVDQKGNRVGLAVSDEGPGIPEGERQHIFQKFYRIGNEQTRKAQGTGLGLYLCKKIAKDHNGTINVADNQPAGSTFMISFHS
jgi:signal transduction histidine kinase